MSLFLFAQSNGHVSSGHLPLAMIASFAAHAAVLLSAPLFPAAPMAPRPSSTMMHVELASPSGATRVAAVRALQPVVAPTHLSTQAVDVEKPEAANEGAATEPHAPMSTERTAESDNAPTEDAATAIVHAPPAKRYAPPPVYPDEARWERRTGRVLLRFHIRPDGSVGDVQVFGSSGHADLDHAASAALGEWRFDTSPTVFVMSTWYLYAFRFDLM